MRRKREKTPPPRPGPLRHSFISLKRRALAPRAWLSRLAALRGGEGEVGLLFARCFATTCAILPACATLLLRPRPHMPRPRPFRRGRLGLARLRRGRLCPRRIPLIPLNPTKSRFEFEFCPRWDEEPDRDRGKICGLVPCSRSFYPCARRPRHVMDGQPGLVPGIRPSMCLPSVRRARLLEMPGTSPGMTACGGGRSERPRTGPTTCKRASETGC